MFLPSNNVASVFIFTILLNFFYLNPVHSEHTKQLDDFSYHTYTSCTECLGSACHTLGLDCTYKSSTKEYMCFDCGIDNIGNLKYFHEYNCVKQCKHAGSSCKCNGPCYVCVNELTDTSGYKCDMPDKVCDQKCNLTPY
jgi:hypothetical protein